MMKFTDSSGNILSMTLKGFLRYREGSDPELLASMLPLIILIVIIALLSVVIILMFRNRKLQLKLTAGVFILSVILVIALITSVFFVMHKFDTELIWSLKLILPVLIVICLLLAYMGIKKDDDIVKSYDRLR